MVRHHIFSKHHRGCCRGFTLIETLIALSIFTIGILAVAALVISSINENALARMVTEATALAEDRLESVQALAYEDIVTDQIVDGRYTVTWNVVEDDIIVGTKSITVVVTWRYRGVDRNVTIEHLMTPIA
jgi:type IV pilus assembly protein PilV